MAEKKIINVGVGIPNEGNTEPEAYDNRNSMFYRLGALEVLSGLGLKEWDGTRFDYPEGVQFKFHQIGIGKVFVALARERIVESALGSKLDYLMMIDDDMIAQADLFEQLFKRQVDIIAPLAFSRYPPHKPVIYRIDSGYDPIACKNYYVNYSVYDYPRNSLVQCDAVGFGAVLINMKVIQAMQKPYFMVMTGSGEDIYFCHQAVKAGFKVYMDTSIKLGHVGPPQIITEEIFDSAENRKLLAEVHS